MTRCGLPKNTNEPLQAPQQRRADCVAVGVFEADGSQETASLLPCQPVLPYAIAAAE